MIVNATLSIRLRALRDAYGQSFQHDPDLGRILPFGDRGQVFVEATPQFRHRGTAPPENFVSVGPQAVDNLLVDILVRDDLHLATFSTGYITSARSTSAPKAIA